MSIYQTLRNGFSEPTYTAPLNTNVSGIPDKDLYITKEQALSRLALSESDFDEFKDWRTMSPSQRVLSDLDFKDDFLTLIFATNANVKSKKELAVFKRKEEHLEDLEKHLKKMSFMNTKHLFIEAASSLYFAYYIGVNGTKEVQLTEAMKAGKEELKELLPKQTLIKHVNSDNTIQIEPKRGKNWAKNQKRRAKLKNKQ